jgi:hypothetical protein
MNEIHDFNNVPHRIRSASAAFQKGIYHLFVQRYHGTADLFTSVIRLYQCLFQLCLTYLLLDSTFSIESDDIRLKRLTKLCADPKHPTRREIDPAAVVNHSTLEKHGKWSGLPQSHPLQLGSIKSPSLLQTIVEARHNLVYRPFMLDRLWEDCTLMDLLENRPTTEEVEDRFRQFISEVFSWYNEYEPKREDAVKKYFATLTLQDLPDHPRHNVPPVGPAYFLEHIFMIYEDKRDSRPTETLLLTYARMLNGDNQSLLEDLKNYRNDLLKVDEVKRLVAFPDEWRMGDV